MRNIKRFLGENVKRMRCEQGMTQAEFAERTALSISFLQNIETAKRWAGPDTIAILARTLKVKESELFHDGTAPAHPEAKHLLKIFCQAFGIEMEESALKKTKVKRAFSYYSKFYHACPDDVGESLLELCDSEGWDWDHFRESLDDLKEKCKASAGK